MPLIQTSNRLLEIGPDQITDDDEFHQDHDPSHNEELPRDHELDDVMQTDDMSNNNGAFDIEDNELSDDGIHSISFHPTQVPTQPNPHPDNTLPPLETIDETEDRDSVSELPTQTSTPPNLYESDDAESVTDAPSVSTSNPQHSRPKNQERKSQERNP